MLSTAQALEQLLRDAHPLAGQEVCDLQDCLGRVLAADVAALANVPPMDVAQMDGYAFALADLAAAQGAGLPVAQRIAAGHPGSALQAGTAARIFTGAALPAGADVVVMQEECQEEAGRVRVLAQIQSGQWIRRCGEDLGLGRTVLQAGMRLAPQHLGLAASAGLARLPLQAQVRVALLLTGDELILPGQPLPPGAIYNANRFSLLALLQRAGCAVSLLPPVADTLEATRAALREAAQQHDLVLSSGGVSVGGEDHVRAAVQAEGELDLWQIAIKPGKPLAFGRLRRAPGAGGCAHSWFIGLPGNPVSACVTFMLFVRPFLRRLSGLPDAPPQAFQLPAHFSWPKADKRNEFLRARINAEGGLELHPQQGSAVLASLVWGDGLIDNPPGQTIAHGQMVRFLPFSSLYE
ncbi:gephyrin-like molybdotransferase Glp [Massilia sp. W12]|uniref:molybdopterin molybdotransferase MoeA n=1 Tax=Massilia sp. W12 TaxID=3126507 RepID=UPI0030D2E320